MKNFVPEEFNFSFPIQLRWNDLDALGHVNNALYITYFEIARGQFMLKACKGWDWSKDMFLIANVSADFIREVFLHSSNVRVHVRTSNIGNKSFVLDYLLTSGVDQDLVIHAKGSTTQIMFDMVTKKTIPIPDWVRNSLSEFDHL